MTITTKTSPPKSSPSPGRRTDITDTEMDAIKQLYWLIGQQDGGRNAANLETVLRLPWIQDNITDTEAEFLHYIQRLDHDNQKAAAAGP